MLFYYVTEEDVSPSQPSPRDYLNQYDIPAQNIYIDSEGQADNFQRCLQRAEEENQPIIVIKPHLIFLEPVMEARLLGDAELRFILPEIAQTISARSLVALYRYQKHLAQSKTTSPVPVIRIEIGAELIEYQELFTAAVQYTRGSIKESIGFEIPGVQLQDNLTQELRPKEYRILLQGQEVSRYILRPEQLLALVTGDVVEAITRGTSTNEPSFGLEAYWIEPELRREAISLYYTVIEPVIVIQTHLTTIFQRHAAEVFDLSSLQKYLQQLRLALPEVYSEVAPVKNSLLTVLQNLLSDQLSLQNMSGITQSFLKNLASTSSPHLLSELIRQDLKRTITQNCLSNFGTVPCITFDDELYAQLTDSLQIPDAGELYLDIPVALQEILRAQVQVAMAEVERRNPQIFVNVLCPTNVRFALQRSIQPYLPAALTFFTKEEIVSGIPIDILAVISETSILYH